MQRESRRAQDINIHDAGSWATCHVIQALPGTRGQGLGRVGIQTKLPPHQHILEFQSDTGCEGALGVITPVSPGDQTDVTLTPLSLCRGNGLM